MKREGGEYKTEVEEVNGKTRSEVLINTITAGVVLYRVVASTGREEGTLDLGPGTFDLDCESGPPSTSHLLPVQPSPNLGSLLRHRVFSLNNRPFICIHNRIVTWAVLAISQAGITY